MVHQRVQRASSWTPTFQKRPSASIEPAKTVQNQTAPVSSPEASGTYTSPVPSDWVQQDPVMRRIMANNPVMMKILQQHSQGGMTAEQEVTSNSVEPESLQLKCASCQADSSVQIQASELQLDSNPSADEIQLAANGEKSSAESILLASRQNPQGRIGWQYSPEEKRPDRVYEEQRTEAIDMVITYMGDIMNAGDRYKIPYQSIMGAILWEALENPYPGWYSRNNWKGPGKIQYETGQIADQVERAELVPRQPDDNTRKQHLRKPKNAITYIAAIMRYHANNYLNIAGFNIDALDLITKVGIYCTLYQGGNSERRAIRLAEQRRTDRSAQPKMGDDMAEWVVQNLPYIEYLIAIS
ncbi:MAG TPA: hypothetical protein DDW76_10445 [Cyanobacteria bacterium UBA11369]|nr:hypothetical protein [Cyanobacteria bacterium UBA11371]HBE30770.1 hypothetical protein [Cyanobacteria bacterium UBA11368]HBE49191.1 hypothetical protein [Cyanobacteria bacterium UBA11369]